MAQLTIQQVASLALGAGWKGEQAAIATAIAWAESGGRTDARGDTTIQTATWGPSIGLWQIRSLKAQRGTGGQRDEIANLNPATNARHAFQISGSGSNWRPWSVWLNGSYRAHLGRARMAVGAPSSGTGVLDGALAGSSIGVATVTGTVDSAPLAALSEPRTYLRIAFFILGLLLLIVGMVRISGVKPPAVKILGKVR